MAFFLKTPPPVRKMLIYRVLGRLSGGAIKGVKVGPDGFFVVVRSGVGCREGSN